MPPPKRRALTLHVPHKYELPAFYYDAEPDVVANALTIGANLYDIVNKAHTDKSIADIETRKDAELALIKEAAAAQIHDLEQAHTVIMAEQTKRSGQLLELQRTQAANANTEERTHATRMYETRVRTLEAELTAVTARASALQERKVVLESARDADMRHAEEHTKALLQHTLDEKQRAIERVEREKDKLAGLLERQGEELRVLSDLIRRKPTNVKNKGSEYEAIFRERLIVAYGTGDKFRLEDTARNGIGHAGDYLMIWGDHTIMWEVKNYDKPVPSAEVEKFRRDMKENPQVRVGVMVSRYTPITGKTATGDREIEFVEGKMMIYLSNFEAMSEDALPSLMLLFKLWWKSESNAEEDETKMTTIRHIEKLHSTAVTSRIEWRVHKVRMEESIRWMGGVVEENEGKLRNAINILHGARTFGVPDGIFRDMGGDEKSQQLIQLILEHSEPTDGGSLILNDLADIVGKAKGLSRDTAKTHIRSVLLDSVIEPPKGKIPGRVNGLVMRPAGI